jgi:hypothetical protein
MTKAEGNYAEGGFFRNAPLTAAGAASEPRGTKRVVAGQSTGNRPRNANNERMGREVSAPDATHTNITKHTKLTLTHTYRYHSVYRHGNEHFNRNPWEEE